MKNNKLISGLILAASIAVLSVSAHPRDHSDKKPSVKKVMKHMAKLDLTADQKTQIKALVKSGLNDSKGKRNAMRTLKKQMKALKHAEVFDERAVKSLSVEMANIKSDLLILHINKRKQVAALLTNEQKAKFKEMKHKRKNRHLE